MSRRRCVAVITVAVGALLGAVGVSGASAAPPAVTDAGEVTHWNQVAVATLAAVPGPNGGAHRRSRSTWAWCRVPCTTRSTRSGRSSIGRICSTAAPVRRRPPTPRSRLPTTCSRSSSRRRPSGRRSRAERTAGHALLRVPASLDAVDDDSFKRQGIAVGHAAAEAMLDAREGDGRFGPSAWVSNPAPGHRQPLLLAACRCSTRPRGRAT